MGRQMLSIHCMIENHSIPIVYSLMECKSRNLYNSIFNYFKTNLLTILNPSIIITDYEMALRDTPSFFFFKCTHCSLEKHEKKGYLNLTNANEFAPKALRMLFALPLLLPIDIQTAFDLVRTYAINHNVPMVELKLLRQIILLHTLPHWYLFIFIIITVTYYLKFFFSFWLRQIGVDILSVNGLPRRTNNCVESFLNQLRIKFNVIHPNLWIFLDHLCQLSKSSHITMTQLSNNLRPTRNQRSGVLKNLNRIQYSSNEYSLRLITMWQFLCRTAHFTTAYERRQQN
ncbi:MULE domain-containing protein [Aphis craccivora]|uniref:MULE domain-containing protein n=1 Tax=Aphis craccivora TaxID=307492 RepID=A0A6G0YB33_APHCR|nr:MULE domain-containing protein [Aphis craccivora]